MPEQPNILLILTDQQRVDSLGAYGGRMAHTPVADALAARGVRFTQAYTPCSVCSPARASVLTGLYPHQHGVMANGDGLKPGLPNMAERLTAANYRLGYAGKWHIDDTFGPTHFGFHANDWLGYAHPAGGVYMKSFKGSWRGPINHYVEYLYDRGLEMPTLDEQLYRPANANFEIFARQSGPVEANYEHYVAEETIQLIDRFHRYRQRDGKPFFMWANFWGPHNPYILPEPYFSMFKASDVELSPSMAETFANKPYIQRAMSIHYQGVGLLDDDAWREIIAKYAGYCALIDYEIGRIVARLEELGILDNTIVIFSADHGSMVGHHRLIDKGPEPYDDIQNIPMIAAGPGIAQGAVCDEFVYLHDLTPTIMDLAGAEMYPCSNAQSLRSVLGGGRLEKPRDDVYMTRHDHPFPYEQRFLRTARYKYAFNNSDIDELYDLETDPDEMVNRIDDPALADVRAEMVERMRRHIEAQRDPIRQSFNTLTTFPKAPSKTANRAG
jgi:arylsulfatase A-like enzyme